MKRLYTSLLLATVASLWFIPAAYAGDPGCDPKFVNPFSDVEWNCMFPIRMAGVNIAGESDLATPGKVSNIICTCKEGLHNRVGISMGFREPARLMDVVKSSFCMNGLGIDLGNASIWGNGGADSDTTSAEYFAQVHYYAYLPMFLLSLMLDFGCTEKLPLDVVYMSEFDPTHNDELLGLIAFPETVLFASPPLVLSCIADAMSASFGAPLDPLFWCAGSWGTMYPLSGYTPALKSELVQSSASVGAKFMARAHRLLISWGSTGDPAMCGMYPMPVIRKTQYKMQLVRPVKSRQCIPIGKTGLLWDSGKNPPVPGKADNFTYMIWRWRDCCAF